jgi:aspartyl-tRNA(Asn)/glutamyl-tRNA(Gln) amidotransferase subunit A
MDLPFLPIEELAPLLRRRKVSPVELARACLARLEKLDSFLNAYITVTAERALAEARRAEREIRRGHDRGPLHGIPISLKDNVYTRGVRTTAGSKILAGFVPDEDAVVAQRLFAAGAVLLGKTNLHEFAYGVTTENPHYGAARNPWDAARIPGGSSGGSAVAMAAGMCAASVGSDTGGSIRIPAAHCGIVGLKPTFDAVSVNGIVPLSLSLDHAGPLARTVGDALLLFDALAPATRAARQRSEAARAGLKRAAVQPKAKKPLRGVVLGRPREYFFEQVDAEVQQAVERAARACEALGARITEVSLPRLHDMTEPSTHMALAEARAWHQSQGWFPARAADYGEDVRKRLEMGADVRAVDYIESLRLKALLTAEMRGVFRNVDAIVAPVTPVAATLIGQKVALCGGQEEPVRAALLRLNRPANFTGLPAISVPCGFTRGGLPMGLQLIGQPFGECDLCAMARAYEQAHEWHQAHPPL